MVVQTDQIEHLVDVVGDRVPAGALAERLDDGQEGIEPAGLQHDSDAAKELGTPVAAGGVDAEYLDPSAVAPQVTLKYLDGRGLARSVGPEEREDFALVHREADSVRGDRASERLSQTADVDDRPLCHHVKVRTPGSSRPRRRRRFQPPPDGGEATRPRLDAHRIAPS